MDKPAARVSSIGLIVVLAAICSAQTGKVEKVGPLTDAAVPEAVRQTLDPAGYRLFSMMKLQSASSGCARVFRPSRRKPQMWFTRNWPRGHWSASCIFRKSGTTIGDRPPLLYTPVTN